MHPSEKSRLTALRDRPITPFVRAETVEDISLYWVPVSRFPMRPDQQDWLCAFQELLAAHLQRTAKLREELFLRFKTVYPSMHELFTKTAMDFRPIAGGGIAPGDTLPKAIDLKSLKEQMDLATKQGTMVDVQRWMPDMTYWFAGKQHQQQRAAFFGYGGLVSLFLAPDGETQPPEIKLPRFMTTAPGFQQFGGEPRIQQEMRFAYSLRDPFLAKSKAMFGEPYRVDPGYEGLLFVVPLFSVESLLRANADQRTEWFSLFDAYLTESPQDNGVLLAVKKPDFDEELATLLETLCETSSPYRD